MIKRITRGHSSQFINYPLCVAQHPRAEVILGLRFLSLLFRFVPATAEVPLPRGGDMQEI